MPRDSQLDFLRGAAMALVVLGHSGFCGTQFLYLFHVPLFFIISGVLFNVKEERPIAQLGNKLKRLYLPNFGFGLLYVVLHNAFCAAEFYPIGSEYTSLTDYLKAFIKVIAWGNEEIGGALWFLRTLFVTYFLYWVTEMVCRRINENKRSAIRWGIYALIIISGWAFLHIEKLYAVRTFVTIPMISFGFIIIGKYANKTKEFLSHIGIILVFTISTITLLVASSFFRIDLAHLILPNPVAYYILGALGFFMLWTISEMTKRLGVTKAFEYIGKNSIPILGLHFLSFKALSFIIVLGGGGVIFHCYHWSLIRQKKYSHL